eukprot:scaffold874_cov126-Cylindrotheca_fusiformis.AAC.15
MIIRFSTLALLLLPHACGGEQLYESGFDTTNDINYTMDQSDAAIDTITSLAVMMFGQCFDGFDLESLRQNPFQAVENSCTTIEAATFNSALDEFQTCSGFDLHELIETFGSVYLGLVLNCGEYFLSLDPIGQQGTPYPRVNPECVEALVGDNPFGRSILDMEEFPESEMNCFADLSSKVPLCTLSEWPIPIVGIWLHAMACVFGSLDQVRDPKECEVELDALSSCLPANDDITETSCSDIRTNCILDVGNPPLSMALPPPFWARPMAQRCKDTASKANAAVLDRYETFRNVCIPADDRAIWDVSASKKPSDAGGASGFIKAAAEENSNTVGKPSDSSSSSSNFIPGFFVGMIIAFAVMLGQKKWKGRKGYSDI